jgi:hypothetical protein
MPYHSSSNALANSRDQRLPYRIPALNPNGCTPRITLGIQSRSITAILRLTVSDQRMKSFIVEVRCPAYDRPPIINTKTEYLETPGFVRAAGLT